MNKSTWQIVHFSDVARTVRNIVEPETSGLERYIAGEHMDTEDLRLRRWGTIGDGYLGPAFHMKFQAGQILYGSRRTYLRKVALADFDGICANTTFVIEAIPERILPELLPFIMQTESFTQHSILRSRGSTNPYVTWSDIARYEFPLPPLDEQRRIAEILWAVEDEARKLVEVESDLRQVVSSLGFHYFKPDTNSVVIQELLEKEHLELQTGPFGTVLKVDSYVQQGIPIVNPINMKDGKLITDDGPFLNYDECQRLEKYRANLGDTILGRKGEVGRAIFISEDYDGYIIGSDIIRVRSCFEGINPKYLYYFFRAEQTKSLLLRHAYGTTMPGINERILSRLHIPVPKPELQIDIVFQFEQLDYVLAQVHYKQATTLQLKKNLLKHWLE